jgi:hypothetical protein
MTDENRAKMREALEYVKSLSERENGPRCSVTEQFGEALALLADEDKPSVPMEMLVTLKDEFENEDWEMSTVREILLRYGYTVTESEEEGR